MLAPVDFLENILLYRWALVEKLLCIDTRPAPNDVQKRQQRDRSVRCGQHLRRGHMHQLVALIGHPRLSRDRAC